MAFRPLGEDEARTSGFIGKMGSAPVTIGSRVNPDVPRRAPYQLVGGGPSGRGSTLRFFDRRQGTVDTYSDCRVILPVCEDCRDVDRGSVAS